MFKLVIADDEQGVIYLIKYLITFPDVEIVGEAHDGIELVNSVKNNRPDIVITDINMPGFTGLEAISKLKDQFPDVHFIIISGYSEFSYAQESVRLGVWNYLLKPVNKGELNDTLAKIAAQIRNETARNQHIEILQTSFEESREKLREKFLLDAWKAFRDGSHEGNTVTNLIPEVNHEPVLDLHNKKFFCLLINRDGKKTLHGSLETCGEEMLTDYAFLRRKATDAGAEGIMTWYENQIIFLALIPQDADPEAERSLKKSLRDTIDKQNIMHSFHRIAASSSLTLQADFTNLFEIFRQCVTAITWRIENPQAAILEYGHDTRDDGTGSVQFEGTACRRQLETALRTLDEEGAEKSITTAWRTLALSEKTPGSSFRLASKILDCVNSTMSSMEGYDNIKLSVIHNTESLVRIDIDFAKIPDHLCEYTEALIQKYREILAKQENIVIVQAKEYVRQHFKENIGLVDVAKYVCLSQAYFSTVFKNETGIGFVEYVQQIRMDYAKEQLKNTKMRILDIAESVGYHDIKSFNKVFMKQTKVTPSEYRKFYATR